MLFPIDLDPMFLRDEHRMVRDTVRKFVDREVKPNGAEWEDLGRVPQEVIRKAGELGIIGTAFPAEYGGSGLGPLGTLALCEELGRSTFGGFALTLAVQADMTAIHISNHGSPEQKAKYLPDIILGRKMCSICSTEPGGGSDVAGIQTSARRDGDEYVLNGSKIYVTSGVHGDIYIVAARTNPEEKGSRGISLFILEKGMPGMNIVGPVAKTGCLSSNTAEIYFDNVRVPADSLLGEEGRGFYYLMEGFDRERIGVGAVCIGLCEAALELTLEWLKGRKAFRQTLWDLHGIKIDIARLVTELTAAKTLLYQTARVADRGESPAAMACMVKSLIPPLTNRILYQCVQYFGGMGYMRENAVERISRDIRVFAIGGGATEVMLLEVSKNL